MKEEKDIKIVGMMINMYCHGKHHTAKNEMCEQCSNLYNFVKLKRENCPYGDSKDYCSQCKIHCYQSDSIMRQQIKDVMRYAAPRMMFTHPILSFSHLKSTIKGKRKKKKETKNAQ